MEVDAFLADAVQASGGKLHALGVGWRFLRTAGFPARHDRIGIGVTIRTEPSEAGKHTLSLSLLRPDGSAIAFGSEPSGETRGRLDASFSTPQGEGSATLALNLDGLVFQEEGWHSFSLAVDGSERASLRFRVQTAPEPTGTEYRTGVYL